MVSQTPWPDEPIPGMSQDPSQTATDILNRTLALLPKPLAASLTSTKPKRLKKYKGRINIMRIRMLPLKTAGKFWDKRLCFYEIGVGIYEGNPNILGGISFLQFSGRQECGAGKHWQRVSEILHRTRSGRTTDFFLGVVSGKGERMPHLGRRYFKKRNKSLPTRTAAADLAWLIKETLPQFQALGSS
jgi:hypothetical protein